MRSGSTVNSRWSPSTGWRDSLRPVAAAKGPRPRWLSAPESHANTVAVGSPMVYAEDAVWPETLDPPLRNANERKRSSSGASRRLRAGWTRKTGSRRRDRTWRMVIRISPTSSSGPSRPPTGSSTRARTLAGRDNSQLRNPQLPRDLGIGSCESGIDVSRFLSSPRSSTAAPRHPWPPDSAGCSHAIRAPSSTRSCHRPCGHGARA